MTAREVLQRLATAMRAADTVSDEYPPTDEYKAVQAEYDSALVAARVYLTQPEPMQQDAIDAAYERAAQACDERYAKTQAFYSQSKENSMQADYWLGASHEARQNAEEIRALKGKPLNQEE